MISDMFSYDALREGVAAHPLKRFSEAHRKAFDASLLNFFRRHVSNAFSRAQYGLFHAVEAADELVRCPLEGLLGVYSRPDRDPRRHTQTTVFVGVATDPAALKAGDDAGDAVWTDPACPPSPLCFDHARMLADSLEYRAGRRALASLSTDWLATPQGRTGGRKA